MKSLEQTANVSVKDKKLLRELRGLIGTFLPTAQVLLYGSVARGTKEPESDYDILILTDKPVLREEEDAVRDAVYELELAREILISMVFCTKDRWNQPVVRVSPFCQEVERDAIAL